MRDPIRSLLNALDREGAGVSIVFCPDLGLRDWLVEQVEGLVPDDVPSIRVANVEAALQKPNRLALLIPQNEREVVLELDGSRDRILADPVRTQPIVLFLLRDGDGQRALALEVPSLRSWVSGSDADPEALAAAPVRVDVCNERERFQERTGLPPEDWLREWRAERLTRDAENYAHAIWADFLVQP
jgi:hypothetical protein